jgi:hypothetical protein
MFRGGSLFPAAAGDATDAATEPGDVERALLVRVVLVCPSRPGWSSPLML